MQKNDTQTTVDKAYQLAEQLHAAGDLPRAEVLYQKVLALNPQHSTSLHQLGLLYVQAGQSDAAIQCFRQVIAMCPELASAYNNLAYLLNEAGEYEEATQLCQKAIEIKTDFPEAYNNLGNSFKHQEKIEETIDAFSQAIKLRPDYQEALHNLAMTYKSEHRDKEARQCFNKLIKLAPDNPLYQLHPLLLMEPIPDSNEAIDNWRNTLLEHLDVLPNIDIMQHLGYLGTSHLELPFNTVYHGRDNLELRQRYAACFSNLPSKPPLKKDGKLKVGFLVTKNHERALTYFLGDLFRCWDCDDITLFIICPQSSAEIIRGDLDHDKNVSFTIIPRHFPTIVDIVRNEAFDILCYWETGSDSINYFLPFFNLAPIQCASVGVPETTGLPTMDYYFSWDIYEDKPDSAQMDYSEKLILNKEPIFSFHKPEHEDYQLPRSHFKLPEDKHLYFMAQNLLKLHPDFDIIIKGIIERDPSALILCVEKHDDTYNHSILKKRFDRTIPDWRSHITFLPFLDKEKYFSIIKLADVVLDSIHYTGGTTTLDCLACGAPIVTMKEAATTCGRVTFGYYNYMDIPELITHTIDEYIDLAVRIAHDKDYYQKLSQKILEKHDRLYNRKECVQAWETFFCTIIEEQRNKA